MQYPVIHRVKQSPGRVRKKRIPAAILGASATRHQIEQDRLEAFFRVYKQLPDGRKKVELNGFNDADTAKQEIKAAWDAWKAKKPAKIIDAAMARNGPSCSQFTGVQTSGK